MRIVGQRLAIRHSPFGVIRATYSRRPGGESQHGQEYDF